MQASIPNNICLWGQGSPMIVTLYGNESTAMAPVPVEKCKNPVLNFCTENLDSLSFILLLLLDM